MCIIYRLHYQFGIYVKMQMQWFFALTYTVRAFSNSYEHNVQLIYYNVMQPNIISIELYAVRACLKIIQSFIEKHWFYFKSETGFSTNEKRIKIKEELCGNTCYRFILQHDHMQIYCCRRTSFIRFFFALFLKKFFFCS